MPKRRNNWVVRVYFKLPPLTAAPNHYETLFSDLLEFLRYAGSISFVEMNDEHKVIDINPPQSEDSPVWAKMNAERIRSFMIKAEAIEKY